MKPIEPGCTALVIGSACKENIGRVVKVLHAASPDYIPPEISSINRMGTFSNHEKAWVCAPTDPSAPLVCIIQTVFSTPLGPAYGPSHTVRVSERRFLDQHLMRLDGEPDLTKTTETDLTKPLVGEPA